MKLEPHQHQLKDEIVSEIKIPIKKSTGKIANFRRTINGGKIFAYQESTGILGQVKITESEVKNLTGDDLISTRIGDKVFTDTVKNNIELMPGCVYLEALNLKNAIKRLKAGKILFTT